MSEEDEDWEAIDKFLMTFTGWGNEDTDRMVKQIRRGPLGVDQVANWLQICVDELSIGEPLLSGKIERLVKAIETLCSGSPLSALPSNLPSERESPDLLADLTEAQATMLATRHDEAARRIQEQIDEENMVALLDINSRMGE